jgi:hypothetical protein
VSRAIRYATEKENLENIKIEGNNNNDNFISQKYSVNVLTGLKRYTVWSKNGLSWTW